ncbi:hypothetical protein N7457_006340 [Penicillium paradoxum]|uniref:uncharacterized protein n=1 Tax=Penicillium paradoxum TaxID=176176 RepID=UPI00254674AE|nr:uncharacterized protein N7457_006340 [Penicillium paradoxum]KAJ5781180.1 hypothetical protein N7457_006340 [Penicillium paradoxum]
MGDPFSILSGAAGIISLGIQTTQGLIDFYSAYKDQDANLARTTKNLETLQTVFQSLKAALTTRLSRAHPEELEKQVDEAIQRCEEIILELKTDCQKFVKDPNANLKGRIQIAGRRAAYPFRKSTLEKLEEAIAEIREDLSIALDVLQLKGQNEIQDGISDLKSLLERTTASQVSFMVRAWLAAPDASLNHNAASAKRRADTGLWLVNGPRFADWLVGQNSFLWLNGFAGCGKSVLCSTAIEYTFKRMKHSQGVGIGYFYFSFTDEAKQDDSGMLRTLLLQLSAQVQDGEQHLEQLYQLHKSSSPPVNVLLNSLYKFLGQLRDCYILVDALDESPRDSKRESVLSTIQTIRDWALPSVHLLITSRDEFHIRQSLEPSRDEDLLMRNPELDEDIENFISYQLDNDPKRHKWERRRKEIQQKLTQNAQGVFRYVECQFNALRKVHTGNQLDKCLQSLPRDLDQTYARILCNIDEDYVEDVRRILTILSVSTRPLAVEELIDAHAVDLTDPPRLDRDGRSYDQEGLIDICLGLVEIATGKDIAGRTNSIARIAHFSVQEYLQSDRILKETCKAFAILSGPAHTEAARICLCYLLEPSLVTGDLDIAKVKKFPLAQFAAQNWAHHFLRSDEQQIVEELVLRLLEDQSDALVTWVRLHDPDQAFEGFMVFNVRKQDLASPIYYATVMGLQSILGRLLTGSYHGASLSKAINARRRRSGTALQAAARIKDNTSIVQMLLDKGADVNVQGGKYGTALQAAARIKDNTSIVQMLLDKGADVNAQGGPSGSALQAAASIEDNTSIVQMLLDKGADVNAQGGPSGSALQAAASIEGNTSIVQMLLDKGADVNAQGGEYGTTLQDVVRFKQNTSIVQMLLDKGADVNAQGGEYGTALQAAASIKDNTSIVQMLLDKGANVNVQGGRFGNALGAAVRSEDPCLVQMLLDKGANVNAQGGRFGDALQSAARVKDNTSIVQMLLDKGADVNAQGGLFGDALQAAARNKDNTSIMQMLLDKGADINAQGGPSGSALQAAASIEGNTSIVQMLLDKGVDVNAQGGDFGNALQAVAFTKDNTSIVQMLLDKGADINAQGGDFGNALQAAAFTKDNTSIVQMLLDKGADVNAQGGYFGNALQAAALTEDNTSIVQMLLDKGADVNAQRGEYGNALQAAVRSEDPCIVQMLLDKGADVNAQGGFYGNSLQAATSARGGEPLVQTLLDSGADVNAEGGVYGNALQAALLRGASETLVQTLLDHGANSDVVQIVSGGGKKASVQMLLDQGVDREDLLKAANQGSNWELQEIIES